jgi:hypothetical protein
MEHHNDHTDRLPAAKPQGSSLKWLGLCVGLVVLALLAITVFKVPVNTVVYTGILLACPLMHVWMMRSGGNNH